MRSEPEKAGLPIFHKGRDDSLDGNSIYHVTKVAMGAVIELLHSNPKKQE
jgi:hypothetical protein